MHATALEYVAFAASSKTVPQCTPRSTIRARSWPKSRFGGSHQSPGQAHVAGQESGPVPLDLVLERGHDRAQKKTCTTLVELKETIGSFAVGRRWTNKSNRWYWVSADELAPAWSVTVRRLRRDRVGLIAWYSADLSLFFVC